MSHGVAGKWFTSAVLASTAMVLAVGVQAVAVPASAALAAGPASATDESKVPHYFGPYPNWANSPLTLSSADVTIDGDGTGAAAVAQVDPVTGGIASIDVTAPGRGYTAATVAVSGSGSLATATATVSTSGVVTGFTDVAAGSGYTSFTVTVDAPATGTTATAVGSGGVDAVTVADGGSGYTMPTVDFDLPDTPGGVRAKGHVPMMATGDPVDGMDAAGTISAVVVDDPGSGYTTAPAVVIRNGTQFDPIAFPDGGGAATATATLALSAVNVVDVGSGYTTAPGVTVADPTGSGQGAGATAVSDVGAITGITVTDPGSGYLTQGMRKFVDQLPVTCTPPDCPTDGSKFLPVAVPEEIDYNGVKADEYVIGLVQYRTKFSSDLPEGALVRGYVQLMTPTLQTKLGTAGVPLANELLDGTTVAVTGGYLGVTTPQYMGPFIAATKDKPVRIVFRNLLPTGAGGDLFLPTDSSMMGSGLGPDGMDTAVDAGTVLDEVRNPACTTTVPKPDTCFKDNRATLHLHGGITPWISDGTPHQWITPAGETTPYPQGVSVQNVPDMVEDPNTSQGCTAADDGCSTFYYTNQQSARLMFYHDHAWGITRLNVYAGEAAGYTIADDTEKKLVADGVIPGPDATLPLVVQDKTFVPGADQLAQQDPTWDATRWGTKGNFWYHHVYMPAQNPGDPSGMSAFGRWMYGPWFWPPATTTVHGPIANPYYDPACTLDDPSTWQYQTDPYCEPEQIPGTPNISAGMEQFNDTPIVNGVAYPTVTLDPKPYRLRILNAANDRFFNFQWYVADPGQGDGTTEVALKPAELAAAQTDPNVFPTPVGANDDTYGPDWVQLASEGGFLPAPAVVDGQQPTTWITDPTRFDYGNVDKHSLLLAPAERADAVVDFSKFAGQTLILYNDAPAAFPARVPQYDYYTGGPDLSPAGAPTTLPGYGPNTRTVMRVTIAATTPSAAFDMTKLRNAFKHNAQGTGVFESGQPPTIVGQSAYNSAYGTSFASSSNCNVAGSTKTTCDGLVRVNDTTDFGFNTLRKPTARSSIALQPKAIHDEMNASTFDEYGRMTANLGVEAQPPSPGQQNVTLYPYINPATELVDATNLPRAQVNLTADGLPAGDVQVSPISSTADGTQIWRFTHNGVDTHPIHFHLYDVQVVNRVTWDNIIIPPDPNELGWKDTVRMSPLEDTIVALRPIIPKVPFEVPNAIRPLNPMMALGSTAGFNSVDVQGNPTTAITNELVNFGWEYVIHCHILSHEEMDMMRPESVVLPPNAADGLVVNLNGTGRRATATLTWNDNSITETSFVIQRTSDGARWTDVGTVVRPLTEANTHGTASFTDATIDGRQAYRYRVAALNTAGYGGQFPSVTASSLSTDVGLNAPAAPSELTATLQSGPQVSLSWRDNATNEANFVLERSIDNGSFTVLASPAARNNTGTVSYVDSGVTQGHSYAYRVSTVNVAGTGGPTDPVSVLVDLPPVPQSVQGTAAAQGKNERITVTWADVSGETAYDVQWSADSAFTTVAGSATTGAGTTTYTTGNLSTQVWYVRVRAVNPVGASDWSTVATVATP